MLAFLKRILVARSIAAAIALLTSAAAVLLLPGTEYAIASVAITFSAIATTGLYLPFSKFVLVSRQPDEIESTFWLIQPLVIGIVVAASLVGWGWFRTGTLAMFISAGVFAVSQGWKDFSGEVLRVRGNVGALSRLYVYDAATTLILILPVLYFIRRAEAFIAMSAASSMFWAWTFARGPRVRADSSAGRILQIYRYSFGVVGSGTLNATTVALARTIVLKSTSPEISGAVQFVLDTLQKAMALFSSSLLSSAIPEVRKHGLDRHLRELVGLMAMAMAVLTIAAFPLLLLAGGEGGTALAPEWNFLGLAAACALLIWTTRFKATVFDLPMFCAPGETRLLLVGSGVALLGMHFVAATEMSAAPALVSCSLVMVVAGAMSCSLSMVSRLCSPRYLASALGLASTLLGSVAGLGFATGAI